MAPSARPYASRGDRCSTVAFVRLNSALQGVITLRRQGSVIKHEDFMDAILEVQAKKKTCLLYYA